MGGASDKAMLQTFRHIGRTNVVVFKREGVRWICGKMEIVGQDKSRIGPLPVHPSETPYLFVTQAGRFRVALKPCL